MEYKGIDVSKYQGNIDFKKVKNAGIQFAIVRIGYGRYESQKDEFFEANYEGFMKQGIPVGVYHYSYATNVGEAKKEAAVVLKWLKGRNLNLPVYYQGGGFNNSDIVFSSELSQKMTNTYEIDPFTYSLSLKAIHSDHFMTDPYAKYETMKVAMLRASSNVLGFNNHKIIGIKASDSSWLNQYPNLSDLINR